MHQEFSEGVKPSRKVQKIDYTVPVGLCFISGFSLKCKRAAEQSDTLFSEARTEATRLKTRNRAYSGPVIKKCHILP